MHASIHGDVISLSSFKNQGSFLSCLLSLSKERWLVSHLLIVLRDVLPYALYPEILPPCCGLARLVYDTKLLQENSLSHCG